MPKLAPAEIPQIFAQQPQPGVFDPFGDIKVLRDIQPDLSGTDFIGPSGIDLGDLDIPDAVTLLSQTDQNATAALQSEAQKVLAQEKAAQNYIDLLSNYMGSANSENKQLLDDAKQRLAELGVSRKQIESATNSRFPEGIDTSQGISGVMGPNLKGAIDIAGDFVVDKVGTGALQALGAYGELFGADKDRLLQDTKVGVNPLGPGLSYIFGDDGKVRTTPLGTTSTGNPVVLSGPIGAAGSIFGDILSGDVDIFGLPGAIVDSVGGLGGAVQTAANTGALGLLEDSKEPGGDVVLDDAGILASILADDDTVTGGAGNDTLETVTEDETVTVDPNAGAAIGPLPDVDTTKTKTTAVDPNAGVDVDTTKTTEVNTTNKFDRAGEITTKVGPPLIFVPTDSTPSI